MRKLTADTNYGNDEIEIYSKEDLIENFCEREEFLKNQLDIKKRQVSLVLDDQKLDTAIGLISGIKEISSVLGNVDIVSRVLQNTESPKDLKFLADAQEKMIDSLQKLQSCNSIDSRGTPKKVSLALKFNDTTIGFEVE